MAKVFDAAEVAKHNTPDSCWVILYGKVYDVTNFLSEHPGGAKIILKLAGKDATEEYDPIHPPGILEENLKPEALLGTVDPATLPKVQGEPTPAATAQQEEGPVPMEALLNMDDIEQVATKNVSQKAWAYYYSAADDKITKSFNTEVYRSILLRPRVFVDCTECDLDISVLGHKLGMPIYVSPAAMARLGHPAGEAGIAEACRSFGAMQIISNNASMTPEQIVKDAAPDQVFGWQIYVQIDRKKSEAMLARIKKLKAIKFIVLTLDAPVPGKREDDERGGSVAAVMSIPSAAKAADKVADGVPASGGVGKQLFAGTDPTLTWKETLPWLAKHTDLPIILKGLQTHEDAYIASLHTPQVKGIILSNHGGRALDTAPPAVHTLMEIRKYCPEVFDKLDVWVDGGIRRGTDVVKALCLGAKAVGIGRPALWGLGAGGVDGVKRTLQILADETITCMRLLGVQRVEELGPHHINTRLVEQQIFDGPPGLDSIRSAFRAKL
ncbi:FMN-dependent alpha-hydroxy acid dehydrogenase [Aspergillus clavatus NRRL 1]|uniref:L-lactate dehydrogenase (cytochrome) n=1 Tax=Aspergillus clavatus (strain ATCC 1007 / CBS 513.65 / DSM 816 / NCTC 3887 / NRRL 1 / QM 1276 / 107) TaxID=344612 RepID=A1CQU5_ASPCL|nr:mitochondrial cytochrome b2, putative [Aspergillus clavatus NRRL 1]EAW08016.1 mitochondrial cytochrome b2, putative [Aspergillus clavatus NRRL 1]